MLKPKNICIKKVECSQKNSDKINNNSKRNMSRKSLKPAKQNINSNKVSPIKHFKKSTIED